MGRRGGRNVQEGKTGNLSENVNAALESLHLSSPEAQRRGLELWKGWLESCRVEVETALASRNVRVTPHFLLYVLHPVLLHSPSSLPQCGLWTVVRLEGSLSHQLQFQNPFLLGYFARFLQRAFCENVQPAPPPSHSISEAQYNFSRV